VHPFVDSLLYFFCPVVALLSPCCCCPCPQPLATTARTTKQDYVPRKLNNSSLFDSQSSPKKTLNCSKHSCAVLPTPPCFVIVVVAVVVAVVSCLGWNILLLFSSTTTHPSSIPRQRAPNRNITNPTTTVSAIYRPHQTSAAPHLYPIYLAWPPQTILWSRHQRALARISTTQSTRCSFRCAHHPPPTTFQCPARRPSDRPLDPSPSPSSRSDRIVINLLSPHFCLFQNSRRLSLFALAPAHQGQQLAPPAFPRVGLVATL
jgi:hypothetical protein